jgi:hypothetical protein
MVVVTFCSYKALSCLMGNKSLYTVLPRIYQFEQA